MIGRGGRAPGRRLDGSGNQGCCNKQITALEGCALLSLRPAGDHTCKFLRSGIAPDYPMDELILRRIVAGADTATLARLACTCRLLRALVADEQQERGE